MLFQEQKKIRNSEATMNAMQYLQSGKTSKFEKERVLNVNLYIIFIMGKSNKTTNKTRVRTKKIKTILLYR